MASKVTIEQIDAVLPQTQCGLCNYKGCKPYAKAIVEDGERIDQCPPGGVKGLYKLAELTQQDPTPYLAEMQAKQKPQMIAAIREDECIGCTKCIQACPVDAILGAAKLMHTIITDECSGCELCIEPCPVDCIDLIVTKPAEDIDPKEERRCATQYRKRYEFRNQRLEKEKQIERKKHKQAKKIATTRTDDLAAKKQFIKEAIARTKALKTQPNKI